MKSARLSTTTIESSRRRKTFKALKDVDSFKESITEKTEDDYEIDLFQENEDFLKRIDSVSTSDFLQKTNVLSYWTIVIAFSNVLHIFSIIKSLNIFKLELE